MQGLHQVHVAPRAGAWIETPPAETLNIALPVAPRAGAWIETMREPDDPQHKDVAPRAGAWIETFYGMITGVRG